MSEAQQPRICCQCDLPLIELDAYGERLCGCVGCNNWQSAFRSLSFTSETLRAAIDGCFAQRARDDAFQKFVAEREPKRDGIRTICLAHLAELSDEFDRLHGPGD